MLSADPVQTTTENPHNAWYLGIDLGTGSCKSIVVNETGRVLGFGTSCYPGKGTARSLTEQDPQAVLEGVICAARTAIEQSGMLPSGCQAISIGSALHTLIAVDSKGEPVTGVFTWADGIGSTQAQAVRTGRLASDLYRNTGCPPSNIYPLYKILWLREGHTDTFQRADRFISVKEYVFEKLTGQRLVDYGLAAGSGLLNTHTLKWDPLSLDLVGIDPGRLSPLGDPLTTIRGISPDIARDLGIPSDTLVVLGSSDAFNSTLGAGAVSSQQATCMVGTSGAFRIVASQPILDEAGRTWCYAVDKNHWLVGGAINNGGIAFSWLKDLINNAFPGGDEISFAELITLAGECSAGSGGLICLPFFTGERSPNWNVNARAVYFGLGLQHDIRHLARALLEGVAYRLRSISEILVSLSGEISEIRASGGFAHSGLWLQIISSVIRRDLLVPAWSETSSLGAAFWAMLGTGAISSIGEVARQVTPDSRYRAIPSDAAVYDRLYPIYQNLYRQLESSFGEIAQFQRDVAV